MANSITLDGTVFQPETRKTRSGMTVFTFNLSFYDGKDADKHAKYGSIRVTAFNDLANNAGRTLQERDRALVEGHITQEHWTDKSGKEQYRLSLIANDIATSISRFAENGGNNNGMDDPEIPF